MSRYVLTARLRRENEETEWWRIGANAVYETVRVLESFESAKREMRKAVKELAEKYDFFPLYDGGYECITEHIHSEAEEELDDYEKKLSLLNRILTGVITEPEYEYEDAASLDINVTDGCDHYFAFVGTPEVITAGDTDFGRLETNIHNMKDPGKTYYFEYRDVGEYAKNSISVTLMKETEITIAGTPLAEFLEKNGEKTVAEALDLHKAWYTVCRIEDLGLSTRAYNCIIRAIDPPLSSPNGVHRTVDEILEFTVNELYKVRNLGALCFAEVMNMLSDL